MSLNTAEKKIETSPHAQATSVAKLVQAPKVERMFASIAQRYDLTNTVLSAGIDCWWRNRLSKLIPVNSNPDRTILDLCTGTGALLQQLKNRGGAVIGADFCLPMLQRAPKVAPLIQADGLTLPFANDSFDYVTVAFGVRNFEDTEKGLSEIARVLKPSGKALVLEFGQPSFPIAPFFKLYSRYLMPLIGGVLTGNRTAYEYLPETARQFPAREKFLAVANKSGFASGKYYSLTGGIAYIYELEKQTPL